MAHNTRGELRELVGVWEVCVCICVCACERVCACSHTCIFWVLLCDSVQLSAVSAFHLVFLIEETAHKKMQNSCYDQIFLIHQSYQNKIVFSKLALYQNNSSIVKCTVKW